ncbi:tRNA pseudouridine synthase B [Acholeplasma sp. CAG:878]|nr:tRNA pseudouridine synthase B [Acholeplasma sp. CAG:878]
MDGVLLVKKPKGMTSRDVVNEVSRILKTKKIGHTGTLDPLAEGVLVLCINKGTKLVSLLTEHDKTYIATCLLGVNTETLDIEGKILSDTNTYFTNDKIKEVLTNFPKTYLQEVPIYSAVKINGKKLYEYARNNQKIELPKRNVNIYSLKLIKTTQQNQHTSFSFETSVSKGTYIRSLIKDIAKNLGTTGIMTELLRTKQGDFSIDECFTIDNIKDGNFKLISIEEVLKNELTYEIDDDLYKKIINGTVLSDKYCENNKNRVVFTKNGKVIAIYKHYKDNLIKPDQMFL